MSSMTMDIGLGWIISDESFMKDTRSWLSLLKIRGSYGITGQQDLGQGYYVWRSRYDFNHNNTHPGVTFTTWGSDILKWEGRVQANIGFDAELFQRRLNVSVDFFNNGSQDMLYAQPLATSTGVSSIPVNVGNMVNRGIEIAINADIVRGTKATDFGWNTRLNITHLKNKLTKSQSGDSIFTGARIIGEGLPVNGWYMPEYKGVSELGEALYGRADGTTTTDYSILTPADYKYFGSPYRDIDGSWTNTFRWKNFDLSFMIQFGLGGKFYDATYQNLMNTDNNSIGQAKHIDLLNAWTEENKNTDIPRISSNDQYAAATSSRFLISNSFANIKNINFGYTIPANMLKSIGFTTLRVYFAADNVYYFAARKGVDLGQSLFGNSSFSYYPYRTFTFGVNIGL